MFARVSAARQMMMHFCLDRIFPTREFVIISSAGDGDETAVGEFRVLLSIMMLAQPAIVSKEQTFSFAFDLTLVKVVRMNSSLSLSLSPSYIQKKYV